MYFTISRDNRQVISSCKKVLDVNPKKAAIDERWNLPDKMTTLIQFSQFFLPVTEQFIFKFG